MNCPRCNVTLLMTDRQGVEIDYCPTCRGIWLDRGELEKIIERSYAPENQTTSFFGGNDHSNERHHDEHSSHGYNKYGRKKNFLSELFD
jgi:Zn-finger nucleic acid-binding protein